MIRFVHPQAQCAPWYYLRAVSNSLREKAAAGPLALAPAAAALSALKTVGRSSVVRMHALCGFSCTPTSDPQLDQAESAARRGASQRHELVLYRRHQPARAHAVVPHHCPVFVGPTRPDFAASLGTNPQKGATVPPLLLGAIVKQESMAPPLYYLTHSSKSRTSSSKRTVPTKVGPRGVRPGDLFV